MISFTSIFYKTDFRQQFKTFQYKTKIINYWVSAVDFNFLILMFYYNNVRLTTSTLLNKHLLNINTNNNNLIFLLLKSSYNSNYYNVDMTFFKKSADSLLISYFSNIINYEKVLITTNILHNKNHLNSLSNLFQSTIWTERELQEFHYIIFLKLRDTRRLLTDYTYSKLLNISSLKNESYSTIYQDLYNRLLHWFFYFLFMLIIITLSFIIYSKSLLQLLILGEAIIILFIGMCSSLAIFFNTYYLIGLSILLLIFGGLELSINLLFLIIKC